MSTNPKERLFFKRKPPPSNYIYLYFFGCWNSGFCSVDNMTTDLSEFERGKGLTKTMKKLKSELDKEDHIEKSVIVAGDNYYPVKIKETHSKYINKSSLESGFSCLKNAVGNTPTTILLGNHDIENIDECSILKYQQGFVSENPTNFELFNFNTFTIYKVYNDHTLIIMLDSTIFSEDDIKCYEYLPGSDVNPLLDLQNDRINVLQEKITRLKDEYLNIDKPKIKNIVFTAHHPIVGVKEKSKDVKKEKSNVNIKIEVIPRFVEFLYTNFFKTYEQKYKYYHLCADVHNYNHMTLSLENPNSSNITIEQYIVGTGGAKEDKYTKLNSIHRGSYNVTLPSLIPELSLRIDYNINPYLKQAFYKKSNL